MGVDRPRGRLEVGRRLLTSPPREEPVDLPSTHSAQELARRLDERIEGWSELYGSGISVRREPNGYRVTPRTRTMWTARPQAVVRVVRDGEGARLTGAVRSTGPSPRLAVLSVPLTLVVLVFWAATAGAGTAAFGVLLLVAGFAAGRVRLHVQHDQLRTFLDELVGP